MSNRRPLLAPFAGMLKMLLGDRVDQTASGMVELFADDGVMEFPYALPGRPRIVKGHEELFRYLESVEGRNKIIARTDPTIHRTTNPDISIFEYGVEGEVVATGHRYEQNYVVVITTKDRKIVNYRDYWNPIATQPKLLEAAAAL